LFVNLIVAREGIIKTIQLLNSCPIRRIILAAKVSFFIENFINTNMKTFKTIDLLLQMGAIIGGLIYYWQSVNSNALFGIYFLVGGLQVVSMLVHFATRNVYKHTARSYYHWITLVTVALMPILPIFYLLLFLAPFMALFYFSLCFVETKRYFTRPRRIFA
jgi:hypothetical protein